MVKLEGTEPPHPSPKRDADHPGYEIEDVNVGGIATFIAGLSGFILIFFVFCFFMGKAINYGLNKQDGPASMWNAQNHGTMGETATGAKLDNLKSNAAIEQQQLGQMANAFPTPRLETDDGNQDTADLHAREDLLLDNYSTSNDLPAGTVRIPIAKAMQLIVQRGLPTAGSTAGQSATPTAVAGTATAAAPLMAGEQPIRVTAPLTDGFARTGYELDTIEARTQRLTFEKATEK